MSGGGDDGPGLLSLDVSGLGAVEASARRPAVAQIVFTLTDLIGIDRVVFHDEGRPAAVPVGDRTPEAGDPGRSWRPASGEPGQVVPSHQGRSQRAPGPAGTRPSHRDGPGAHWAPRRGTGPPPWPGNPVPPLARRLLPVAGGPEPSGLAGAGHG